jgi:heptose I phosphotransferase
LSCLPADNEDHIPEDLRALLPDGDTFEKIMGLTGEIFRNVHGRRTIKVRLGKQSCFVKQHFGVGWGEILKNLLTGRMPILGAGTEWRAIHRLGELGIPTTPAIAYASRGCNPAQRRSFVITRDLGDIVSLEDFCSDWITQPPPVALKHKLIAAVADIARRLHDNGLNHRDFYICHFCLDRARLADGEILLYLIDLHRVGIRAVTPQTARMKDLAALYFSALDAGLTRRDCLRFMRRYRGNLRGTLNDERPFWKRVETRARKLYHKFHGRWPVTPFDMQTQD